MRRCGGVLRRFLGTDHVGTYAFLPADPPPTHLRCSVFAAKSAQHSSRESTKMPGARDMRDSIDGKEARDCTRTLAQLELYLIRILHFKFQTDGRGVITLVGAVDVQDTSCRTARWSGEACLDVSGLHWVDVKLKVVRLLFFMFQNTCTRQPYVWRATARSASHPGVVKLLTSDHSRSCV